jgi:hypothetical protein
MITHRAFSVVPKGMTEEDHFKRIRNGQWLIPYLTAEEAERVRGDDVVCEVEMTFHYVERKKENHHG